MKKYQFGLQYPKPLQEAELDTLSSLAMAGNLSRYTSDVTEVLERTMADFFGTKHAITCSSGTAAIHAALIALDLPVGSEIITTAMTDAGVVLPIIYQNLVPVFADIDSSTYNLDPECVERCVTPQTSAIIAVHLAGNPCPLTALRAVADKHGIVLIEDCSQAHGAQYGGQPVGSHGKLGIASLQQSKHITSGEGGVIVTSDDELATRLRLAVDKGWTRTKPLRERTYEFLSLNYRYSGLQAAVVLPQMKRVSKILTKKRKLAGILYDRLGAYDEIVRTQRVVDGAQHSFYSFPTYVTRDSSFRDRLLTCLSAEHGVECAYGYANPQALYLCVNALRDPRKFGREMKYSTRAYPPGTCPNVEDLLDRSFLLPFNEMFDEWDMVEMADRLGRAIEQTT